MEAVTSGKLVLAIPAPRIALESDPHCNRHHCLGQFSALAPWSGDGCPSLVTFCLRENRNIPSLNLS